MSKTHLPVIGMPLVGTERVRDVKYPCEVFEYGTPSHENECEGDGHYLCRECVHWRWDAERTDANRFERLICGPGVI